MASLSSARQKAKNAAYLVELKQLITALKLYREDEGDWNYSYANIETDLLVPLVPDYIPKLPDNPSILGSGVTMELVSNPYSTYYGTCDYSATSSNVDTSVDGIILIRSSNGDVSLPGVNLGFYFCHSDTCIYSYGGPSAEQKAYCLEF